MASACDYVYATEAASIKLSEISIGIAPLVIAPAVETKNRKSRIGRAFVGNPTEWKNAYWAKEKGLFSKVFDSIAQMDKELDFHVQKLGSYNPEALDQNEAVFCGKVQSILGQIAVGTCRSIGQTFIIPKYQKRT